MLLSLHLREEACQNPKPWALPLLCWVFCFTGSSFHRGHERVSLPLFSTTHTHTHKHFLSQDALNVHQLLWCFQKTWHNGNDVPFCLVCIKWSSLLIPYPSLALGILMIGPARWITSPWPVGLILGWTGEDGLPRSTFSSLLRCNSIIYPV